MFGTANETAYRDNHVRFAMKSKYVGHIFWQLQSIPWETFNEFLVGFKNICWKRPFRSVPMQWISASLHISYPGFYLYISTAKIIIFFFTLYIPFHFVYFCGLRFDLADNIANWYGLLRKLWIFAIFLSWNHI